MKNGAIGAANFEIVIRHVYRVWYADILSNSYSPFQNLLLDSLTYQLLKISTVKSEIPLATFVGSYCE